MAQQQQQWMRAQDTFIGLMDDGTERSVVKGDVLPASHELVSRDAGGTLFRPLDPEEPPAPKAKAAPAGKGATGGAADS